MLAGVITVGKFTPEPVPAMDLRGWEKARSSLHAQERPGGTLGQDKLGPNINPWWDAPLFPPWAGGGYHTALLPTKPTSVAEGCEADESRLCKELWDLPR